MSHRSGYPQAEPTGRLWYHGHDAGVAFALTSSVVVTACHVIRDFPGLLPSYLPDHGESIPVEEIEKDEQLDIAVLRLRGSVPAKLAINEEKLEPYASWRIDTNPLGNYPALRGEVEAYNRLMRNDQGYEAGLMQLRVAEGLGRLLRIFIPGRRQPVSFKLGGSWKRKLRALLHSQLVGLLRFATDSRILGALTRESALLWDARTGQEILGIPGRPVASVILV